MRRYIRNIFLLIKYYFFIKKLIAKKGYKISKLFKFQKWHHGYAYFIVTKKNKDYFMKVDTKFKLLQNDLLVYNLADKEFKTYLAKIYDSFMLKNMQIIIYEYYNQGQEIDEKYLINNIYILEDIIKILEKLNNLNIIHRDIKLDNFFIIDTKIKILDFTFANSINKDLGFKELDLNIMHNFAVLEFLGEGLNPKPFVWNDCYALLSIIKNIEKRHKLNINLNKLKCKKFVTYSITPSKKYLKIRNIKMKIKSLLRYSNIYRKIS